MPTSVTPALPTPREVCRFLRECALAAQPKAVLVGDAILSIDPTNDSKHFSSSGNTAGFLGVLNDLQPEDAGQLVRQIHEKYRAAGSTHCFVTVHPNPKATEIKSALLERGFWRMDSQQYTPAYPTLIRPIINADWPAPHTELSLRTMEPAKDDADSMSRFGMYAGETCVAKAGIQVIGEYALLTGAWTDAPFRNRGAQSTLIDGRLRFAQKRGCRWAVSETLSILKSSLGNLQRFGFETLFIKPIYEWRKNGAEGA